MPYAIYKYKQMYLCMYVCELKSAKLGACGLNHIRAVIWAMNSDTHTIYNYISIYAYISTYLHMSVYQICSPIRSFISAPFLLTNIHMYIILHYALFVFFFNFQHLRRKNIAFVV